VLSGAKRSAISSALIQGGFALKGSRGQSTKEKITNTLTATAKGGVTGAKRGAMLGGVAGGLFYRRTR
jgi:hypothetical protein